ncbi:MAG: electron transfer flavoprotein subunit alpha/FixB family protein [Candidatus Caldarchaeum sp.]
MKVLVAGEKPEQVITTASYAKSLNPAQVVAAAFKPFTENELAMLGGAGVEKLIHIPEKYLASGAAASAAALAELVKKLDPALVLIYASKKGVEICGRLAQRLDAAYASEAFAVEKGEKGFVAKRLVLGGGYVATVSLNSKPALASVKVSASETSQGMKPAVEEFDPGIDAPAVEVLETIKPEKTRVDLEKASLIVSVGRGFKKKEDLSLAEELAKLIGAEIGCSRPISGDLKWLEEERHIGLSGKRVRPNLYVALGISGQVQHLVGMRDSKTVIAVNTDPNAPMATESDYYFVADLYKILPLTIEILKKKLGS